MVFFVAIFLDQSLFRFFHVMLTTIVFLNNKRRGYY